MLTVGDGVLLTLAAVLTLEASCDTGRGVEDTGGVFPLEAASRVNREQLSSLDWDPRHSLTQINCMSHYLF